MSDIIKQIKIAFEEQSVRSEIKKLQDVLNRADVVIPVKLVFNVGGKNVSLDQLGGVISGAVVGGQGGLGTSSTVGVSSVQRAQEDTRQALNRMSFGQYASTTTGMIGGVTGGADNIFAKLTKAYEAASGKFEAGSPQAIAMKRWEDEIKELTGTFSKLNRMSEDLAEQFDKLDDVAKRRAQDDLANLERQKQDTLSRAREATSALGGGGGGGALGMLMKLLGGGALLGTGVWAAQTLLDMPVRQMRSAGAIARGRAADYMAATGFDWTSESVDLNNRAREEAMAGARNAQFRSDAGSALSWGARGAAIGAGLGSFIPGLGTVIGGVAGGILAGGTGFLYNQLSGASQQAREEGFRSSLQDKRNQEALNQARFESALRAGTRNYQIGRRIGMTEGEMGNLRGGLLRIDDQSPLGNDEWDDLLLNVARGGRGTTGHTGMFAAGATYYDLFRKSGIAPGQLAAMGNRLARRQGSLSTTAPGLDLVMGETGSRSGTGAYRLDQMLNYGAGAGFGGNAELLGDYANTAVSMMEAAGGGFGAIGGTETARALQSTAGVFGAGQVSLGAGARLLGSMNAQQTQTTGAAGVANATAAMRAVSQFAPNLTGLERVQLMNTLMVRGPSALSDPAMMARLTRSGVKDISGLQNFLRQEKLMEMLRLNPLLSSEDLASVRSGDLTGAASDALMDMVGSDNVQAAGAVRDWALGAGPRAGTMAEQVRRAAEQRTDAAANPSAAVATARDVAESSPTQEARKLLEMMGEKALSLRSMVEVLDRVNVMLPVLTDNASRLIETINRSVGH